ncbi:MAG: hypothetical protein IPG56_11920 [Caulobacteraceae bacterium]|nr:hypothetical protein [Caulobacteraceae bacterium]
MLIVIRRGALLKAPVLSRYLRAYRRASLLKARDDANKALAKLDAIEGGRRRHDVVDAAVQMGVAAALRGGRARLLGGRRRPGGADGGRP